MERNILKSSLEYASFRILFQILFRCVTFILNAWILRLVGAEVLGVMNVRLLLLESTILFLCKEPCLKACQTNAKRLYWPQVINQIWITVPACIALSAPLLYVWLNYLSLPGSGLLHQYQLGCYAIVISCIIDQFTNVPYIIATSYCFVKIKIVFDAVYIAARTVLFVVLVVHNKNNALAAFAFAQVSSSILFCLMYYIFFWWYIRQFNYVQSLLKKDKDVVRQMPKMFTRMQDFKFKSVKEFLPGCMDNTGKPIFDKDMMILSLSFGKQCVVKQVLTEGERYVMTVSPVLTFREQATYDVVNNLGSLAARFLFRPIEESAYFYFTQMIRRDTPIAQQNENNVQESAQVLSQLCAVVFNIGLLVLVFGQSYSHTLLSLYGGETLTDTTLPTTLLQCHCFAVVLLAINGVTECYVFATMDNQQLDRYNYLMVIFSISFLLISYVLTYFIGAVGFILANCINMGARIIHSCIFISKQFRSTPLRPLNGLYPKPLFSVALVVSGIMVKISEYFVYPQSIIIHIAFGGALFALCLLIWAHENKSLLKTGMERYRRKSIVKLD